MNKNRTFIHHLYDISDSILKIKTFIENYIYEEFCKDEKTHYAVIRALEIIGEAVKQIPEEVTEQYNDIPWKNIKRMRDKLIHHYFGIDLEVVWKTVNEDLENLEKVIQELISKYS